MTSWRAHLKQQFKGAVVADAALAPGLRSQVGEPDAGYPILVVGRVQVLELLTLLAGHKSWRGEVGVTGVTRPAPRPRPAPTPLQAGSSPASTTWSIVGKRLKTAVLTERRISTAESPA